MSDKDFYQTSAAMPENDLNKAHKQLKIWQLLSGSCLIIILLQCVFIGYLLTTQNEYVYVARVKPGDNVENIVPLQGYVTANETEKLAFIRDYIHRFMTLSLDPVLVHSNWVENYKFSGIAARKTLSQFIQQQGLVSKVGKQTQLIHILSFNAISNHSYQFTWDVITYDQSGKKEQTTAWSGVFTLTTLTQKRSGISELVNPFGLQVESFSLNKLGG